MRTKQLLYPPLNASPPREAFFVNDRRIPLGVGGFLWKNEMKTSKLKCSFKDFDKQNAQLLTFTVVHGDLNKMQHLSLQYRAYAKRAYRANVLLYKALLSSSSQMHEYKRRAEAAEHELSAKRKLDALRTKSEALRTAAHMLHMEFDELRKELVDLITQTTRS